MQDFRNKLKFSWNSRIDDTIIENEHQKMKEMIKKSPNIVKNEKNKILRSAKKAFANELSSIKTLSSTFNNNFCKAVELIYNLKGRVKLQELVKVLT